VSVQIEGELPAGVLVAKQMIHRPLWSVVAATRRVWDLSAGEHLGAVPLPGQVSSLVSSATSASTLVTVKCASALLGLPTVWALTRV
jgi:hypothetical protein